MTDEQVLMRRVRAGDVAAFETLVERHYSPCLRFAWRQLGQREDAEEVVQDAMLRAFRALRSGRPPDRLGPWLMRVVVNRCRSVAARDARRRRLLGRWLDRHGERGVPPPDIDNGIDPQLRTALDALSPALREAFLLKYVEELSYEQMSAITGVRTSALKMRVKRAAERLATMLETAP